MSQHGCPERLSNRSKGFQDDGPSQSTMEVLVETLTGTAFEMTVLPTDTIFAIKSKIFRVEGIPVSQQHLLYNLKELDDASSLREHAIADGARLRLVLGMRGGPISTRRLPPPPSAEPWRDIERLLDTNRDDVEWGGSGCKVTVLVFRDGERVNMLRVKENNDGTYSPLEHNKYSGTCMSPRTLVERAPGGPSSGGTGSGGSGSGGAGSGGAGGAGSLHDNAVTMGKMLELRRRMESLSVQRTAHTHTTNDKVEIQKTRSEETLSVPKLLDDSPLPVGQVFDGHYTRYDYGCAFSPRYALLPPLAAPAPPGAHILEECLDDHEPRPNNNLAPIQADYGPLVCGSARSWVSLAGGAVGAPACGAVGGGTRAVAGGTRAVAGGTRAVPGVAGVAGGAQSASASSLHVRGPPMRRTQPLSDALFSSSTSDLENLKRNTRILPALSRHRPREHLHLSDERLDACLARPVSPPASPPLSPPASPPLSPPVAPGAGRGRVRCGWCRKRLSVATLHRCRCGGHYCAPHRYAEVHGCCYDYRGAARAAAAALLAPKLPRI